MAALVYSVVLDDGTVAVAGTEESPELRERITNPLAWGEQPEADDSSKKPRTRKASQDN